MSFQVKKLFAALLMILYYCCRRNSKTENTEKRSLPPLLVDKLTITTLKTQLVVFLAVI